ncbi:hypothetical protein Pan14r_20620 [Crateriforma conspicua]|uniref:DinB superfamily protein n=2 Tax=Crateriforma conspicua TaxID=2527996 RepID=A0A5C5Y3G7_9PLAN|nr:hypothetical protein Mal65_35220 [Crateriforma conspicua]TWT69770.1 hypothetical protein Pan14r_20620 [Crateriforma conspicua]
MNKAAEMNELRKLQFDDLEDATDEATRLLQTGYQAKGRWTLGQICRHLRLVQDPSIDGYPWWMSAFAFLRPVMRRTLLPKILTTDSPRGIPTSPPFQPGADLDDALEVERFAASVVRLKNHNGPFAPHPAFGKLERERLLQVHTAHAAHHLRFLDPDEPNTH